MAKQRPSAAPPVRARKKRPAQAQRSAVPAPLSTPASAAAGEPPRAPRRPSYYEAIALYETGVRALQRHDFEAGAEHFRLVIQRYPDERELLERARLYLRVCERETARRPAAPNTVAERIYAATIALNAGDRETALGHLRQALAEDPRSDHAHYIMAVAMSDVGDRVSALEHLRAAVSINPENRPLALQDPDLASLRETEGFRQILQTTSSGNRQRMRGRR